MFCSVITGEYCDYESFEASCDEGEIVVIGKAKYGHIALGRCVDFDTGQLGCETDVFDILNAECSGKQSCSIPTVGERFRGVSTCRRSFAHYLQTTYACIKGRLTPFD